MMLMAFGVSGTSWATVDIPDITPAAGRSTVSIPVTVTCDTAGAELRYTTDGTSPTVDSLRVPTGGQLTIARSMTLTVNARTESEQSADAVATFTISGDLAVGGAHVLAVRANGEVWAWGAQQYGRLGNGVSTAANIPAPHQVYSSGTTPFANSVQVAAGAAHSLALDANGDVWSFGYNNNAQLGDNTTANKNNPVAVLNSPTTGQLGDCIAIAAGTSFSMALQQPSGVVRTWGDRANGRLGDGSSGTGNQTTASTVVKDEAGYPALTGIVQISAGEGHGLARTANPTDTPAGTGIVYAWGLNSNGQLGIGNVTSQVRAVPVKASLGVNLTDVIQVSAGNAHSAFLRSSGTINGEVWCAGAQAQGRLGNGATGIANISYPVRVTKTGGGNLTGIVEISAGPRHTLARDLNGNVWAWGYNAAGELGDGLTTARGTASLVKGANGSGNLSGIVKIVAGGDDAKGCSFAIAADGTIYGWGFNTNGQLGIGTTTASPLPVAIGALTTANRDPLVRLDLHQPVDPGAYEVTDRKKIKLVASVVDPDGPGDIAQVSFYRGSQLLATLTSAPWVYEWSNLAVGNYAGIYAVAVDKQGSSVASALRTFDIPLTALQATGPPLPDWDMDGIPDSMDDGGVNDWTWALEHNALTLLGTNLSPLNPSINEADGPPTLPGLTPASLLGYWDFEAYVSGGLPAAPDRDGSTRTMTFASNYAVLGSPPYPEDRPLVPTSAAAAIGPQPVYVNSGALSGQAGYAIGAWLRIDANSIRSDIAEPHRVLIAGYDITGTNTAQGWLLMLSRSISGELEWRIGSYQQTTTTWNQPLTSAAAGLTLVTPPADMADLAKTFDDGNWHQVTVAYGSGWRIYVDGKLLHSGGGTLSLAHDANSYITFGNLHPNIGKPKIVSGAVDRVRIYSVAGTGSTFTSNALTYAKAMFQQDLDRDGLPDRVEMRRFNWVDRNNDGELNFGESTLDPFHYTAPNQDHDNDGLLSVYELSIGTDPFRPDTDGDGMSDGFEVKHGFDPLTDQGSLDPDNDGLTNRQESIWGTNPLVADSDGDGFSDGQEVTWGSDPTSSFSKPPVGSQVAPVSGSLAAMLPLGSLSSFQSTPPPSEPTNQIGVRLADNSTSASESWTLMVGPTPVQGEITTSPSTQQISVDRGDWHEISLSHNRASDAPGNPDYDYLAEIDADSNSFLLYDGPDNAQPQDRLLGNHNVAGETTDTRWMDKRAFLVPIERQSLSYGFNFSGNDAAGPRYRKVSLEGRPLADSKPESQGETDDDGEQTYVDAFDLSLRHDNSLVHVPIAASELVLQASMSATETGWTDRSGLRPRESLTNPFGVGWSTNLCSYVEVIDTLGGDFPEPKTVNVIDENGHSQRFTMDGYGQFYAWPSARVDAKTYLNRLELDGADLVLTKKYGTTLRYEPSTAWFAFASDRKKPGNTGKRHTYWRLKSVTDRHGNQLVYDYSGAANPSGNDAYRPISNASLDAAILIPGKISAVPYGTLPANAQQKILIGRNADCRRIDWVEDPKNQRVSFSYLSAQWASRSSADDQTSTTPPSPVTSAPNENVWTLTSMAYPDGTSVAYAYEIAGSPSLAGELEQITLPQSSGTKYRFTDHIHANIKSIRDRRLNSTVFNYSFNQYVRAQTASFSNEGLWAPSADIDDMPQYARGWVLEKLADMNGSNSSIPNNQLPLVYGLPRVMTSISLPGGGGASFSRLPNSGMVFRQDGTGRPTAGGQMGTKVVDSLGNITKYYFEQLHGEIVDIDVEATATPSSSSYNKSIQWMLYYTGLKIEFCSPADLVLGWESYGFDLEAGLAVSSARDFSGNITTWTYDNAGMVNIPYRPRNLSTMMTKWPDPILKIDALGRSESYQYEPEFRQMAARTDVHNVLSEYSYDLQGRKTAYTVTDANGQAIHQEAYFYTHLNFPAFMTERRIKQHAINATGKAWEQDLVTSYVTSPADLGRLMQEIQNSGGLNLTTSYLYDLNNNRTSLTDPRGNVTVFNYDAMNRLKRTDFPATRTMAGLQTSSSSVYFNANGQTAAKVDENGNWIIYCRDLRGRVTAVVRDIDGANNPTPNANGIIADSQLVASIYTSTADLVEQTGYNLVGMPTIARDARGFEKQTYYDALMRPIHRFAGLPSGSTYDFDTSRLAAEASRSVLHEELYYDDFLTLGGVSVKANPGGTLFDVGDFKPTRLVRKKAVREVETGNDSAFTTYAVYDSTYRQTYLAEQYSSAASPVDDGFRTTLTSYGPAVASGDYLKEPRVVTVTDDRGRISRSTSDGMGRVTLEEQAVGTAKARFRQSRYSSTGLAWKTIDFLGRETETAFDAAGRGTSLYAPDPLTGMVTANSPVTTTFYDNAGNATAVIDPLGRQTESSFDARNRKYQVRQPSVQDVALTSYVPTTDTYYDLAGNVTKVLSPNGATQLTFYDRAHRAYATRTNPTVAPSTAYGSPNGADITTTSFFDKGGLVTAVQDGAGNSVRNAYDSLGRLTATVSDAATGNPPDPSVAGFNPASYQGASSQIMVVVNSYDDAGNLIEVQDGKGQKTGFTYDGVGRKTRTLWDPYFAAVKKTETVEYDGLVSTRRTDAAGRETYYLYDALDQLTEVVYGPLASSSPPTSYHLDNQLRSYDIAGRLGSVTYPNEPESLRNVAYTYDKLDRITTETSAGTTHSYTEYDKVGNRKKVVYGRTGRILESAYDALDRLETLTEKDASNVVQSVTAYRYDRAGNLGFKALPNGNQVSISFDLLGRQKQMLESNAGSILADQSSISHDKVGNVLSFIESRYLLMGYQVVNNSYDRAYRLLSESVTPTAPAPTTITSYTYDPANNRKTKTVGATTTVYNYGDGQNGFNSNQLISFGPAAGAVTRSFTYDANGNRATRVANPNTPQVKTDTYTWDCENRLTKLSYQSGAVPVVGTYRYRYDYRGRRVIRDESGISGAYKAALSFSGGTSVVETNTREIHDPEENAEFDVYANLLEYAFGTDPLNGTTSATYTPPYPVSSYEDWAAVAILKRTTAANIIGYRDARTTLKTELIRASDMGGGVGSVVYSVRAGQRQFNSYNSRGDVILTSDSSGNSTWAGYYEAFGTRNNESGSNPERQRANTKDEDPTGLLNEGFRYRDLEAGMFISRDPAGFVDGPNVYTYVRQNPWTAFDPDGLKTKDLPVEDALADGVVSYDEATRLKWKDGQAEGVMKQLNPGNLATDEETRKGIVSKDIFGRESVGSQYKSAYEAWKNGATIDEAVSGETARRNKTRAAMEVWKAVGDPNQKKAIRMMQALYEVAELSTLPLQFVNPSSASKAMTQTATRSVTRYERVGLATETIEDLFKNPSAFGGRSPGEVMKMLDDAGIRYTVRPTRGSVKTGSVLHLEGNGSVQQLQFHPGGGRHGSSYWKLSTSNMGKVKSVDPGYIPFAAEKTTIIPGRFPND